MVNYEEHKKTIEEFKEKILEYFKENKFDITIEQLFKDLNFNIKELNLLEYILDNFVEEKLIKKSRALDHIEYDLVGEKI